MLSGPGIRQEGELCIILGFVLMDENLNDMSICEKLSRYEAG